MRHAGDGTSTVADAADRSFTVCSSFARIVGAMTKLTVGDRAPEFELLDQDKSVVTLSERLAQGPIVLYFYPKDDSPGCTAEACGFRDQFQAFTDAGVAVIGVSDDSPESHRQFAARHRLPFTLLSDPDGALRRSYGVESFGPLRGRVTFVIDGRGVIRQRFSSMTNMLAHVDAALQVLNDLRAAVPQTADR
jgi:peroxiredoxin Q/BCP